MADEIQFIFKSGAITSVNATSLQGQQITTAFRAYVADPSSQPALFMQFDQGDMSVICAELSAVFWRQN